MTEAVSSRVIDHLVLPVGDIDTARARYQKLGFTVAPDGKHPFGTENCCVFFKDGTFLEPLGIAHRETCEAHALKGNSFIRNDQAFRFRRSLEGLSHLVIKSQDAKKDHKLYKKKGLSGGKKVNFSRDFATPDGQKGTVSFHLAFAADQRSPDAGFFSCQVVNPPQVDRSALQHHQNGVLGIKEVVLSEINPTDFQYFLQTYLHQREMSVDSFGMSFETGKSNLADHRHKVSVLSPDGMKAFFDLDVEAKERGMLFQTVVLAVANMQALQKYLEAEAIAYSMHHNRLIILPAEGQGIPLFFEEAA